MPIGTVGKHSISLTANAEKGNHAGWTTVVAAAAALQHVTVPVNPLLDV